MVLYYVITQEIFIPSPWYKWLEGDRYVFEINTNDTDFLLYINYAKPKTISTNAGSLKCYAE
jgi:hypothetical protein